ncbi:hypothetical protein MVEG_00636 [Podila verticillata NRRL 6337]|nr:hypothetical protein MVEG_00636 [Podila verticillata NRRL 6337]
MLSQGQSLAITKKVLRSSLGCIMYLRGMFPEEAFEDDNEHQVRVKRMVRGQNSEADILLDWLENGIFDALSRQYLRQLVVGISLDLGETEMHGGNGKTVETYTFDFSYQGGYPSVQLESPSEASGSDQRSEGKDKASTLQTVAQVQGSIAQMLRRLIVYTQTLEALTAEKFVNIRLYYRRDITPTDYEPPGFGACRPGPDPFQIDSAAKVSMGKVSTAYHSLKLHIQHMQEYPPQGNSIDVEDSQFWVPESSPVVEWPEQERHEELPPRGYNEQSATKRDAILVEDTPVSSRQPSVIVNPNASIGHEAAFSNVSTTTDRLSVIYLEHTSSALSNRNSPVTSSASSPVPMQTGNKKKIQALAGESFSPVTDLEKGPSMLSIRPNIDMLDCVCGTTGDEGDMFQCIECRVWGHLWCYGYSSCRDPRRPAMDLCYKCLLQKQALEGPDLNIFFANPLWANLQDSCLMRRAIAILWQEGYTGCYFFSKRMGIKITKARAMEKVLIEQEYLRNQTLADKPDAKPSSRAKHDWRILKGDNARGKVMSTFDPGRLLDPLHTAAGSRQGDGMRGQQSAGSSQADVGRLSLEPSTQVGSTVPTQVLDSIPSQISDIRASMPDCEETPIREEIPVARTKREKAPEWVRKVKASEPLPRDDGHHHQSKKRK